MNRLIVSHVFRMETDKQSIICSLASEQMPMVTKRNEERGDDSCCNENVFVKG